LNETYTPEKAPAPGNSGVSGDSFEYCAEQVRLYDSDRYFSSLFAPPGQRKALIALYAFNLEIAKTRETVSEPMLGHIRLQWWRDALDGIYRGTPRQHTVVLALGEVLKDGHVPRCLLDEMIDGRERDLEDEPMASLEQLAAYCAATSGALTCAALAVAGSGEGLLTAGREAGTAYAMTGLIRAAPYLASAGRSVLPGIPAAEVVPGSQPVRDAIRDMAGHVEDSLVKLGSGLDGLSREERPAVLPFATCRADVASAGKAGFDPFAFRERPRITRHARMMWALMTGKF